MDDSTWEPTQTHTQTHARHTPHTLTPTREGERRGVSGLPGTVRVNTTEMICQNDLITLAAVTVPNFGGGQRSPREGRSRGVGLVEALADRVLRRPGPVDPGQTTHLRLSIHYDDGRAGSRTEGDPQREQSLKYCLTACRSVVERASITT